MTDVDELERWMAGIEDEHTEFKKAAQSFSFDKIVDYSIAIANEGGGKLVLGVTNARPRRVVGTSAVADTTQIKTRLFDKLQFRVNIDEVSHPAGRVVVFRIPSRPTGHPLHNDGRYLMRAGESLVPMSADQIRTIFDEAQPDFSAFATTGATVSDLSPDAIERFRTAWIRKSGNQALAQLDTMHLLSDAELLTEGRITNAAMILLAKPDSISRFLPHAEVVFEWRDSEKNIDFQNRNEFNAVAHRDYRSQTSVFVRQSPAAIEIESPGGFPHGVTVDNILFRQVPRNRRLSETLAKVGLVERSGQGVDRMFATAIREGKEPPDFSGSDAHRVSVVLRGTVQDPNFLRFLEKVADTGTYVFATADLVLLDFLKNQKPVPPAFRARLEPLEKHGVIERVGRGRGTKYILSKTFYEFVGTPAAYTRSRGLDRQTNKELLAQHLRARAGKGSSFGELSQVLPALSRQQMKSLLRELKEEGRARVAGITRAAVWFASEDEMKKNEKMKPKSRQ